MSGFLLCWHRSGGALAPEVLDRVRGRLAMRGPEGGATVAATDAVAVHTAFTDAIGAEEDLPLRLGDLMIAADLRLDDRARLRAHLRDVGDDPPAEATDARLLASAMRCWGDGAASRLLGDFAFAALDLARGRLVAARGTFGVKPLFVAETRAFVACSNDIEALLELPGVDATPDEAAITEFLRSGTIIAPERTARRGVRRVPPSGQLAWGRSGPACASRHWEFPVPAPLRFSREADYTERFNELLDTAVRDRLRVRRASIMLSGGLDSPALAVAAQRGAPDVVLQALTISSERVSPSDEREWAERVARHLGLRQEVHYTESTDVLAHCGDATLRTPEPVNEPEFARWRRVARRLSEFGAVTFDGEDGDALLAPPDLFTMLRTLPWAETARAWRAYRAAHGVRPWLGLRQLPALRRRREAEWWTPPAWLRPELLARHGTRLPEEPPAHPTRSRATWGFRQPVWETLFALDDPSASGAPLSVLLPMLDARLFEYAFAVPPIPWCQRKQLLRSAMAGRLPDDVLRRPKTPLEGAVEASVARWRADGGPDRPLASPMDHLVDVAAWRRSLRDATLAEDVVSGWRVFEVARWLAQPGGPGA